MAGRSIRTAIGHSIRTVAGHSAGEIPIVLWTLNTLATDAHVQQWPDSPECKTIIRIEDGRPDPRHISTSYVERQNLTIRMAIRRFTRLTNAFSKKLDNHKAACALHFAYYNFCRIHRTLRVTPAMEAGITDHIFTLRELLACYCLI